MHKTASSILVIALLSEFSFAPLPGFCDGMVSSGGNCRPVHRRITHRSAHRTIARPASNTQSMSSAPSVLTQPAVTQETTSTTQLPSGMDTATTTTQTQASAPIVLQQPAVVDRVDRGNNWLVPALVAAGVATAIAVPVSLGTRHHHRGNRGRQQYLAQQQLLYFQRPTP